MEMTRRRPVVAGIAAMLVLGTVTVLVRAGRDDDRGSRVAANGASATTTSDPTSTSSSTTSTSTSISAPTTVRPVVPTTTVPGRVITGRLPMLMPLEVVAVDARTAWVIGSSGDTGVFARTADGGRSWSWLCTGRLLTGVAAIDAERGVVVAARAGQARPLLYTTADGGRTLSAREIDVPIDLVTTVDFVGEHTGVIAGTSFDPDLGSTGVVASTTDAGATWRVRTYPGVQIEDVIERPDRPHIAVGSRGPLPPVVIDLDGSTTTIEDVAHLRGVVDHDGRLVAVGASKADADGLLVGPSMVQSSDRGATWAAVTSSPAANLHAVEAAPGGELWAAGQIGNVAAVLVSSDGGSTWSARHTSADGGAFTSLAAAGTSVWALGYQPGLAVAGDAVSDGASWLTVPIGPTPSC